MTDEEGKEDLCNINIPKSEGHHEVARPTVEIPDVTQPVKMKHVNIGSEAEPKFMCIGDYWDEDTVGKVLEVLHEFRELFPTKFMELKGILRDLGVMEITLKPDVKLVKQRPYRLNLKYKEKVKEEFEKMVTTSIIELVEES